MAISLKQLARYIYEEDRLVDEATSQVSMDIHQKNRAGMRFLLEQVYGKEELENVLNLIDNLKEGGFTWQDVQEDPYTEQLVLRSRETHPSEFCWKYQVRYAVHYDEVDDQKSHEVVVDQVVHPKADFAYLINSIFQGIMGPGIIKAITIVAVDPETV